MSKIPSKPCPECGQPTKARPTEEWKAPWGYWECSGCGFIKRPRWWPFAFTYTSGCWEAYAAYAAFDLCGTVFGLWLYFGYGLVSGLAMAAVAFVFGSALGAFAIYTARVSDDIEDQHKFALNWWELRREEKENG